MVVLNRVPGQPDDRSASLFINTTAISDSASTTDYTNGTTLGWLEDTSEEATNVFSDVTATVPPGCVLLKVQGNYVPWDNPDMIISQAVEQMWDMIVAVVFLNICYIISAPTNVLNMLVFYKQGLKERVNVCLFALSLADLLYMTGSFLMYCDRIYIEVTRGFRRGPVFQFVVNNYVSILYGFNFLSGFLNTLIAFDRCLTVVSPLRSQRLLKTRTVAKVVVVAGLVIVGLYAVVATRWHVACVYDARTGRASPEIVPGAFYLRHRALIDALDAWVYGLVYPFGFVITTTICTTITVIQLKRTATWREQTSSASSNSAKEVALTRMLVGCSALFLACYLPVIGFKVAIFFAPELSLSGRQYNMFTFLFSLTELTSYGTASFNFFIYYSLGSRYRQTLTSLRPGVCSGRFITTAGSVASPAVTSTFKG